MSGIHQGWMCSARESNAFVGASPQWFAVQTKARHEKRIEAELNEKGIIALVPVIRESHCWSDRTKVVEVPVFSCYAFVRLADAAQKLEVLKTPGVFRFVSANGKPAPIPASEIDGIQAVLDAKLPITSCGFLRVGQRVRVRGGSLDGVEGVLLGSKGDHRLVVSIELIQKSISVTIEGYAVEPVQ